MEGLLCLICGQTITHDFADHYFPMLTRDTTLIRDLDQDGDGHPVKVPVTLEYEFCAGDLCLLGAVDTWGSPVELTTAEEEECYAALNEIFERESEPCC